MGRSQNTTENKIGWYWAHENQLHMCDRVDQLPLFPYNRG